MLSLPTFPPRHRGGTFFWFDDAMHPHLISWESDLFGRAFSDVSELPLGETVNASKELRWVPISDLLPKDASPVHRGFLDYWLRLRGDRAMPSFKDFDPVEVPSALSQIFVVDAMPDGSFVYRVAGSEIEDRYNRSLKGAKLEEIMQPTGAHSILERWRRVRDIPAAFYVDTNHRASSGRSVRGERLVVPMGEDGEPARQIIGVTLYRASSRLDTTLIGDQEVVWSAWSSLRQ